MSDDDRVARALDAWSGASRLRERERERIRTAILLTPEVDAIWWEQFNAQLARLSNRHVATGTGAAWARAATTERVPVGWGCAD